MQVVWEADLERGNSGDPQETKEKSDSGLTNENSVVRVELGE